MSPLTDRSASRHLVRVMTAIVGIALILNSLGAVIALENNQARIKQIQRERTTAIARSCREQNARHDATVRALDRLIKRVPPKRKTRAIQSRAGTLLLIDALAPKRNCARLIAQTVPSG